MPRVISILLASISTWFRSRLALQLELIALRHQVAIYKQRVFRSKLQPADRWLWVWLSRLWPHWQQSLAFVQPRTVISWQQKRFRDDWRHLRQAGNPGRPALSMEVRALIQDMWHTNPTWGSPRLVGELLCSAITPSAEFWTTRLLTAIIDRDDDPCHRGTP